MQSRNWRAHFARRRQDRRLKFVFVFDKRRDSEIVFRGTCMDILGYQRRVLYAKICHSGKIVVGMDDSLDLVAGEF